MADLSKVRDALCGTGDQLRERIFRDIGSFTVPLFASSDNEIQLAGTGTLFALDRSHYILTAAHVWEEKLRHFAKTGIGIVAEIDNRFFVNTRSLEPCGMLRPAAWNEWGPDLTFLHIPSEVAASIKARRNFYDPKVDGKTVSHMDRIQAGILMGTPHELGSFRSNHADVQVYGRFLIDEIPHQVRKNYDYFDVKIDTHFPGTPKTFGGVSGGGLWVFEIYLSAADEIEWVRTLEGVAFYELPRENDLVTIRCHGPRSISAAISSVRSCAKP